ncbi:hypothetical protein C1X75_07070 [Pseudomonas sp. FW305-17]|nr:hypothetical protein C1X79_01665 [Pseudomonas sp. FW305-42]PNA26867.1 hypothetical protein C1X78_04615 [Pseudomonas sp. MPR-R1B]PNB27665.1 hypothetical protein C1X80_06405 [Pseudomonas sp. DP16D-E2]PNB44193.1 hypothetical protein C1X75_07070 [Pseudomonas sp. FW305-17]PNB63181.1 hypothetical protein C1X77_07885 [Pseudomonas sp. GW531-E2]PNB69045.1 hypothetical protein C1X76_06225 [Pseudomonas sp. FW305-127]
MIAKIKYVIIMRLASFLILMLLLLQFLWVLRNIMIMFVVSMRFGMMCPNFIREFKVEIR